MEKIIEFEIALHGFVVKKSNKINSAFDQHNKKKKNFPFSVYEKKYFEFFNLMSNDCRFPNILTVSIYVHDVHKYHQFEFFFFFFGRIRNNGIQLRL